jgi:two-component system OmpR family response regulator/two-component system response regulator QseB
MTMPLRLLLAEDDPVLGPALVTGLQRERFDVHLVADGVEAYAALQKQRYDALVLDLGLPGLNGLDLLHRVRQTDPELPVIVATAHGGLRERIRGLELGADDYLPKPFELDELVARLRAVARRSRGLPGAVLKVREVEMDLRSHRVRLGSEPVWLTGREFTVLKLLMENAGRPVSRQQVEQHLYGWGDEVEGNVVDVYVYNLRKKLGRDFIHTYRGSGYSISL